MTGPEPDPMPEPPVVDEDAPLELDPAQLPAVDAPGWTEPVEG